MNNPDLYIVGVTGYLGSGKSTARTARFGATPAFLRGARAPWGAGHQRDPDRAPRGFLEPVMQGLP